MDFEESGSSISSAKSQILGHQTQTDSPLLLNSMQKSSFISNDDFSYQNDLNNKNYCGSNKSAEPNNNNLTLKQQVMLNQFISIAGCSYDQARSILSSSNWQYQSALNVFFDEFSIMAPPSNHLTNKSLISVNNSSSSNIVSLSNLSLCAPSNTPVTPPNLEYLEKAFSKLNPSLNNSSTNSNSNSSFSSNYLNEPNLTNNFTNTSINSTENRYFNQPLNYNRFTNNIQPISNLTNLSNLNNSDQNRSFLNNPTSFTLFNNNNNNNNNNINSNSSRNGGTIEIEQNVSASLSLPIQMQNPSTAHNYFSGQYFSHETN